MEMNRYAVTYGKTSTPLAMPGINPREDKHHPALSCTTAGLHLLARHAAQFSSCLMDHYRVLFDVMSKLCGHINGEMKKTSYYALEAFLKQVSEVTPIAVDSSQGA